MRPAPIVCPDGAPALRAGQDGHERERSEVPACRNSAHGHRPSRRSANRSESHEGSRPRFLLRQPRSDSALLPCAELPRAIPTRVARGHGRSCWGGRPFLPRGCVLRRRRFARGGVRLLRPRGRDHSRGRMRAPNIGDRGGAPPGRPVALPQGRDRSLSLPAPITGLVKNSGDAHDEGVQRRRD